MWRSRAHPRESGTPDSTWRSRTHLRGSRSAVTGAEHFPPLAHVVTPDPSPSGKRVRDRWSGEMESRTMPRTTATTGAIPHCVLPTVLDHCTPAIQGEDDDFHDPLCMYTVPPCVYKRGVGPLGRKQRFALLAEHIRFFEPRYWHSPQSTSPLAETWELPSLSRLACTPYYRHLRCKIIQCPRTLPCWTYGPAAGIRINPCVTVFPLASTSGTRKQAATLLVGSGPPGQDTDTTTCKKFQY